MSCLSNCRYTLTLASLTDDTSSSSTPQTTNPPKPATSIPKTKPTRIPKKNQQQNMQHLPMQKHKSRHRKQLALMEIERAIGAGTFRDAEPRDLEEKKVLFNGILPDFSRILEGPVEKQLRETGEWFSSHTEEQIRSSRKEILMLVFKWILPIWTLSLLVASGVIKLPFSIKFIDDLIM